MLMQLLTETLFGALTGYMTNDTAIRSLFKPGGVIEQTRDDFAKEAGLLLEDQVLTRAVLEKQLALPEVQQTLAEALDDFLQQQLPQALEHQKLDDLPDYAEITAFLKDLLVQFLHQEKEQILLLLKKYLPVERLLTEQQCQQISGQLETILLDTLQQEAFAVRFWNGWQKARGQQSLEQLGLGAFCDTVLNNAAVLSRQWPQQICLQYGEVLHQLLQHSIQKIELRPVLLELDGAMEQYTLRQYLACDEKELALLVQNLLASEEGQAFLAYVAEQTILALETIDVPAAEIVPEGLLEELTPLLQQQIPLVMERVMDWLQRNETSVNAMLEDAIDEIAGEIGGMKGMLLEQLKETVLAQVLEQSSLVDLLQQSVLNEQTSHEAVVLLMQRIREQLTEQKLGELVQKLNEKQALQKVVQTLLTDNLQRMVEKSGEAWAAALLDWKPGSLKLAEHQQQIELLLADIVVRSMDKLDLSAFLFKQRDSLQQTTVSQFLQLDETRLHTVVEQAVRQGCSYLADKLPQASSDAVYRPLYTALEQMLMQRGQQWLGSMAADNTLSDLLAFAQGWIKTQQPQLVQLLSQTGLDKMQGQLSRLAEEQIQRLSNEEMLKLVEDLMGQEFQPLNYLGAGMGAVAGATVGTALSAALPVTAAASPAVIASVLAGKSAVFGAVGYSTNCVAVKGLFWPYEPVGGIEMMQGVIPKQKARFARSMGHLVDRYVINETILSEMLQKLAPELQSLGNALAADEQVMQMVSAELAIRRQTIVQPLLQWLKQNGEQSTHMMLERFGGMPFAFLRSSQSDGLQPEQQILPMLEQWLNRQIHRDVYLNSIVSAEQFWHMARRFITAQSVPDLKAAGHALLHSDKTVQQLLHAETQHLRRNIQNQLEGWMSQKEHSNHVAKLAGRFLSAERIKQWLEHSSGNWVEQNLSSLFRMAEQALLQILQNKQEHITAAVQTAILNRMGLMQRMGYAMMDGDIIVAQVAERVLHQKLPIFLSVKSRELQGLFQVCWEEHLFPAVLQVPVDQKQMAHVLETLLEQPVVHQCAGRIAGQAAEQISRQPIAAWGRLIQIDGLLERVQIQLGFQWQRNAEAAVQSWQPLVQNIYDETIGIITLRQLTRGCMETIPLQQMVPYDQLSDLLRGFQLRLLENIAITRPQQWLCWPDTAEALEQAVHEILLDDNAEQWMQYEAELLILQLAEQWPRLLPQESRNVLMQPVMQAVFATAETYGTRLLQAMDLSRLTEVQLIAMDSAHLERVVRGFAGHYLVHIENRGWMGAVFALPGMLIYLL
ncbi:MAG: DUF445 family protein [Peptococcaceae bacterium]|nr:DUF445 family protein [Peptococcaceae bacterium]